MVTSWPSPASSRTTNGPMNLVPPRMRMFIGLKNHATGKIAQRFEIRFSQLKFKLVDLEFHIFRIHNLKKVLLGNEHEHVLVTLNTAGALIKAECYSFIIELSFANSGGIPSKLDPLAI